MILYEECSSHHHWGFLTISYNGYIVLRSNPAEMFDIPSQVPAPSEHPLCRVPPLLLPTTNSVAGLLLEAFAAPIAVLKSIDVN